MKCELMQSPTVSWFVRMSRHALTALILLTGALLVFWRSHGECQEGFSDEDLYKILAGTKHATNGPTRDREKEKEEWDRAVAFLKRNATAEHYKQFLIEAIDRGERPELFCDIVRENGDSSYYPILTKFLQHKNPNVSTAALRFFQVVRYEPALDVLRERLRKSLDAARKDPRWGAGGDRMVIQALANHKDKESLPLVKELRDIDLMSAARGNPLSARVAMSEWQKFVARMDWENEKGCLIEGLGASVPFDIFDALTVLSKLQDMPEVKRVICHVMPLLHDHREIYAYLVDRSTGEKVFLKERLGYVDDEAMGFLLMFTREDSKESIPVWQSEMTREENMGRRVPFLESWWEARKDKEEYRPD